MSECYCQFVDGIVNSDKMPESCNAEFILGDGKCTKCENSPLLKQGVKTKDLLINIYEK